MEPCFDTYAPISALAGARIRYISLVPPDFSLPREELLRAFNARTKAIILNTPHNPTGALMGACLALGAIAGGADRHTVSVLDDAGRLVGFAFQIHDDLLNAGSTLRRLGKRAGTDAARGKATYPRVAGTAAARRRADLLLDSARGIIRMHCSRPARLLSLVEAVAVRER